MVDGRTRLRAAGSRALRALGYELQRSDSLAVADISAEHRALFERVTPYTQTSLERVVALADAVEYVVRRDLPGDFVECGVWRGGSAMAIALTLSRLGIRDRRLWLYDTFGVMPPGGEHDADYAGRSVTGDTLDAVNNASHTTGLTLSEVKRAIASTGYPPEHVEYVQGLVEETIPDAAPQRIVLLRLDTDWYDSTRHELVELYPRLQPGGVLIVDDYGHYAGARKAVDDYFASDPILLSRIDYTGRLAIKV